MPTTIRSGPVRTRSRRRCDNPRIRPDSHKTWTRVRGLHNIDLGSLIVQVKGGNARGLTGQVLRTQASTGTPTVGYAPGISDAAWRNAAQQGIPILRTPDELLAYVREFG